MKYVTLNYDSSNNIADIKIIDESEVQTVSEIYGQMFITVKGFSSPVMFHSDDDSQVENFVNLLTLGYKGLKVELA